MLKEKDNLWKKQIYLYFRTNLNMKKLALLFVGALLCNSCFLIQQGRIANGMCRPKHPTFKLLKTPFKETNKLTYNKVYVNQYLVGFGIGFYPDGRLMYFYSKDGYALKESDIENKKWENARNIGYWRTEGNKIKIEYFVCSQQGTYFREQGEIKGDTLVFYENFYHPFYKEVRERYYVLSDMSFE